MAIFHRATLTPTKADLLATVDGQEPVVLAEVRDRQG